MTEQAQHGAGTQAGADLTRLWEEHIRHEFVTGSTEDTLDTMVEDTYVNHIPVLTGGCGQAELREFYSAHFIPRMPPDMEMVPVSRTIGSDQLVDEMVIKFTHSLEIDWMLPGIPATGRPGEVPLVRMFRVMLSRKACCNTAAAAATCAAKPDGAVLTLSSLSS